MIKRRYQYSEQFVKTNFSLGHGTTRNTTYSGDYNEKVLPSRLRPQYTSKTPSNDHGHLVPSCTQCKYTNLLSAFQVLKDKTHAKDVGCASDQKKVRQGTNITFGNDPLEHVTAYREFTSQKPANRNTLMVAPPMDSQVLPPTVQQSVPQRSSFQNDYTYFGPGVSDRIHEQRVGALKNIQDINARDSVNASLMGKRRKILTRSMVDYRHPLDRLQGNIKDLMVQRVSPYVRKDSVWSISSPDNKTGNTTEANQNFRWPGGNTIKIFTRGGHNDILR